MAEMLKLCKTDEVNEGEALQANPEGMPAVAVYLLDGEYYASDDMCTHGMAWLTDGYVEDGEVECPFHGGRFDIKTGEPTAFPCVVGVKTYPVTIEDGYVCIERPSS
jgi:ethylbenzene dioxygenase ferredoxin component